MNYSVKLSIYSDISVFDLKGWFIQKINSVVIYSPSWQYKSIKILVIVSSYDAILPLKNLNEIAKFECFFEVLKF